MSAVLKSLLSLFGYVLPSWVVDVLVGLVEGVIWTVAQVGQLKGLSGSAKLEAALGIAREFADEYLDAIPLWAELGEARRDRILASIVELVLFVALLAGVEEDATRTAGDSGDARRARRRAVAKLATTRPRAKLARKGTRTLGPVRALDDLGVKDLRKLAKGKAKGVSKMKRAELLELLG